MKLTAVYKQTGKWFTGWIEELQGVHTQGRTLKSCRNNLRDALSLYLKIRKENARRNFADYDLRETLTS